MVKADLPSAPGSSGTGEFSLIWYADGNPGPGNDGSPEMMRRDWGNPGYFGFRRWAERLFAKQDLEEAKHTGHLRLDDGKRTPGTAAAVLVASYIYRRLHGPPFLVTFLPAFCLLVPGVLSLIGVARLAMPACPAQDADGSKGLVRWAGFDPNALVQGSAGVPAKSQFWPLPVREVRDVANRRCGHPGCGCASALAWPDQVERPVGRGRPG